MGRDPEPEVLGRDRLVEVSSLHLAGKFWQVGSLAAARRLE